MTFRQPYLRALPAVDRLLQEETIKEASQKLPRKLILEAAQNVIENYRNLILQANSTEELEKINVNPRDLAEEATYWAEYRYQPNLKKVINATGTVLHTNLGRAPLAEEATEAMAQVADSYCNLELSLEGGERGSRLQHLEDIICELTGAEAAMVVNNNAAAVFLVLNTLASGGEVIVSRGQLVEIGGSFRVPDVMSASGAHLVEVGTTNKCYPSDYQNALNENTCLYLKVHTSNYQIVGFTQEVNREKLVSLGQEAGIPVMEDLGSGVLLDLTSYGLPPEPTVQECIEAGVDIVTFSGDKLLGGPQAGVIVGKKELIEKVRKNQVARALRIEKLTIAALEATLRLYLEPEKALEKVPVLRMLTRSEDDLKKQAQRLQRRLRKELPAGEVRVEKGFSTVGGGAFPLAELPSYILSFSSLYISVENFARKLRLEEPPLVARIQHDSLLLDVRTIKAEEEKKVAEVMRNALHKML